MLGHWVITEIQSGSSVQLFELLSLASINRLLPAKQFLAQGFVTVMSRISEVSRLDELTVMALLSVVIRIKITAPLCLPCRLPQRTNCPRDVNSTFSRLICGFATSPGPKIDTVGFRVPGKH